MMSPPARRLVPLLIVGLLAIAALGTGLTEHPTVAAPPSEAAATVPPIASPTPTPSHAPSPTPNPSPTGSPSPVRAPAASGWFIAEGTATAGTSGSERRYLVEVEPGVDVDVDRFAAAVHATLADPRSWTGRGERRLTRVSEGAVSFRVTLATPATVDRECRPLHTGGHLSCWNGARAMLNADRWANGAATYGDDVEAYRQYLVNHEVGHALGFTHASCTTAGSPAHVMVQQTKSLSGCLANPWPYPDNLPDAPSATPSPTSPPSAFPERPAPAG